ncbi:MAG: hypothetical protein AABW80_00915 [Nanoarchaeota archaeon]
MEELRDSLFNFVGRELVELSWRCNFPINPNVGVDNFLQAFRDDGVDVAYDNRKKNARFSLLWGGDFYECSLTYDEIVRGWGRNFPGCSREFYNSVFKVLDCMEENSGLRDSTDMGRRNSWDEFRGIKGIDIRNRMECGVEPYFMNHHEHVLLPLSGRVPELGRPKLFDEVMESYPLYLHHQIVEWQRVKSCFGGPCAEYIPEFDLSTNPFNEFYHPSDSSMTGYFWALYLNKLARDKGYEMNDGRDASEEQRIQSLCVRGCDALKDGCLL